MKPNKGDQFYAETIAKLYQERTGETNVAINLFVEVFRKSVAHTMLEFRHSYLEIFDELPKKNTEEFYKMVFRSCSKGIVEGMALPPCLAKDFYDGHLNEIKTGGGTAANIIRKLGSLKNNGQDVEMAYLAGYWEIINPKWRIYEDLDTPTELKCSSIPDVPIDFDRAVFSELLKENLPELVFYLEAKLEYRPPLRDISNEERVKFKWVDKIKTVRFAEDVISSDPSEKLAVQAVSNMLPDVIVHGEGEIAEPKALCLNV